LEIYHGNAAGGLDSPVVLNEGSGGPVVAGDFSGDGRIDLVIGGCNRQVTLFLQGNDGLLHASATAPIAPSTAGQSAVADLNGDGLADLALALGTGARATS
jgi:hypothetical protein